jgi:hypothetical protein
VARRWRPAPAGTSAACRRGAVRTRARARGPGARPPRAPRLRPSLRAPPSAPPRRVARAARGRRLGTHQHGGRGRLSPRPPHGAGHAADQREGGGPSRRREGAARVGEGPRSCEPGRRVSRQRRTRRAVARADAPRRPWRRIAGREVASCVPGVHKARGSHVRARARRARPRQHRSWALMARGPARSPRTRAHVARPSSRSTARPLLLLLSAFASPLWWAAPRAHAWPLLFNGDGSSLLTSGYGGDVLLSPDAGGACALSVAGVRATRADPRKSQPAPRARAPAGAAAARHDSAEARRSLCAGTQRSRHVFTRARRHGAAVMQRRVARGCTARRFSRWRAVGRRLH